MKNAGNHAIDLMMLAKQWDFSVEEKTLQAFQGFRHGDNKDPKHPPWCAPSNFVPFAFHWQFVVRFLLNLQFEFGVCQILNTADVLTVPLLPP